MGTLSNDDGNAKKTSLKLWFSVLLFFFAIIPTHLSCLMWPHCLGTEFVGTNLVTVFGNAMQTNVQRKFATKEEKFGNVKIAHFRLFLPLLGTQKNVNAGN